MKKIFQTIVLSAFTITTLSAQINTNYIFSQDSLKGFDESYFINSQVSQGISGQKLKKNLDIAKREFVYEKYFHQHTQPIFKTAGTTSVNPGCTNMDFETGSFFGWTVTKGTNTNSSTMAGCCPLSAGIVSAVIPSTGNDAICGALLPLTSPFGGNSIARINNSATGAVVERLSQSFNVTSSNAIFQLAYAGVLENAAHSCADQPFMNISVIDSSGNVLFCPKIDIAAPSSACNQSSSVTAGWTAYINTSSGDDVFYHTWDIKTIDLSPYIGTSITIEITVGDCAQTGHFGYGYFDCKCYPLEISLNGNIFDATPQTPINVSTCGALTATVIAPFGLNPYLWNGPSGSGVTAVTTQSMFTSTPATYTLTMNPVGNCYGPITKYIILNVSPNPTVTSLASQATCTNATGSGTINVVSGSAPFTYNWLPPASTSSLGVGLLPSTNYTVNVVDTFGCKGTTTVSIASFTNGPTYTITPINGLLNCITSSLTVSANTFSNTIAVWSNTTSSSFTVNSPGTFTCSLTNTVSGCTATVPVTVNINTTTPTSTLTSICNNGNSIILQAVNSLGTSGVWANPSGTILIGNPVSAPVAGVYSYTATLASTGCIKIYSITVINPTFPNLTASVNNNIFTCITNTALATASFTTPGTTLLWTSSSGTISTSTSINISSSGSYTVQAIDPANGCYTQSVITIGSNTLSSVSITAPSTIIPCSTGSLALTGNGTVGGPYTYTWTPSSPIFVGNPKTVGTAGVYTVVATNSANGCTTTATYSVSAETISASFIADPYQGLMPLPVSFTNTNIQGGVNYSWDLANGATPSGSVVSTTYNSQGIYAVVLTATKGVCKDTATRLIRVDLVSFLTVPNVFTPNGDNRNDVFKLDAINMGEIYMVIYDRWGLKMFESTDTGKMSWDGKTKSGNTVTDGTYFYVIKAVGLDDTKYDLKNSISIFQ